MAGGLDTSVTDGWLPNLPDAWTLEALRWNTWVRARLGWRGLTADEYVADGVPLLSTPDIKSPEIAYRSANRVTWERYEESPEIKLSDGDVLLTKDGATIGIVNLVTNLPEPSTVNGSIAVLTPKHRLTGRYLRYCLASEYAQQMMALLQGGMGVPHLFQADIKRMRMPVPPMPEQRAIADYLDRETAEIDLLIEKQTALIDRLRERRVEVIGAGVTRGDGHARLVATGDPWVAELPEHWGMSRIHYGFEVLLGKMLDAGRAPREDDVVLPYLRAANVQPGGIDTRDVKTMHYGPAEASRLDLRAGDLLVVEGGSVGTSWLLRDPVPGFSFQKTLNRVRSRGGESTHFLHYVLIFYRARGVFDILCSGSTIAHLTSEKLRGLRVPTPPVAEQRAIADHLDHETARIDEVIAKTERFIELTRERRSALITAAVTGQIDVSTKAGVA